ncbi:MAG: type II toxin-antitoxin system CcdA family antitoxin [Proteobacteria bacterium]|nr:type II toxin-antitoxin system CcdA family antitoxin [Pseudomonadota bacterium]
MNTLYDESAPKKAVNLSINSDLLKKAKDLKINLSATFENALTDLIRQRQHESWKKNNKQAIKAYNKHVEKHGVFSKELRSF